MRMLVRSEWAGATLPSRVAPQEINYRCFVMTGSCPSKVFFAGTGVFLVGNAAVLPSPAGMFYATVQRKENYRNE